MDTNYSTITAAMIWVLILYLTVPLDLLSPQGETEYVGSPNPIGRTIKMLVLAMGVIIALARFRLAAKLAYALNPFFSMFLVLVPLSILWSTDPSATSARFISILSVFMSCFAFCLVSWQRTRFQDVVRPLLTFMLLASLIFAVLAPELAIHQSGNAEVRNALHGITSQKNILGQIASFGVIFWLHAWLANEVSRIHAFLGGGVAVLCLILTRSSTSLLATVFSAIFMLMLMSKSPLMRTHMPKLASVFALVVLVYALAVLNLLPGSDLLLKPITAMTGKDMTFSNRSEIWAIVKERIELSPYIGSGYGSYWTGPVPTSPSYVFLKRMGFYPNESHNGYLEIVNELGLLGLLCLCGYLAMYVWQSLRLLKADQRQGTLFLGLFFHQAVNNLSESFWLSITAASTFVMMTLATIALSRGLLELEISPHAFRVVQGEK